MPIQKDFKRLVRARMKKTGESYTAARAQLAQTRRPKKAPAHNELEKLAGIKDATILAKSGKSWAEWVRILDAVDGVRLSHGDIAKFVSEQGVDGWWSQSVTVGYERIKGLREKGQRRSGRFDASKSKTLPVRAKVAYDAFVDTRTRKKWLPGVDAVIRTATKPKSVRIGAMIGAMLGFPGVVAALLLAYATGAVTALGLLAAKKTSWTSQMAFGTFLSLAAAITLFFGERFWGWYAGLLGV